MTVINSAKRFGVILILGISFSFFVQAADFKCDICGMPINEHGRNHIILRSSSPNNDTDKPMHVCSPSCAHKLQKHAVQYCKAEVTDFNHPDKILSGDVAYFLIQSSKIKSDMGANVMAPYAAAFSTKEEAEAAKKRYGDGIVVQGSANAFK